MNHHIPVLLDEVIKMLNIKPEGIYMDCTIGFGGHSELILNQLNSHGKLIGLDLERLVQNLDLENLMQRQLLNKKQHLQQFLNWH